MNTINEHKVFSRNQPKHNNNVIAQRVSTFARHGKCGSHKLAHCFLYKFETNNLTRRVSTSVWHGKFGNNNGAQSVSNKFETKNSTKRAAACYTPQIPPQSTSEILPRHPKMLPNDPPGPPSGGPRPGTRTESDF